MGHPPQQTLGVRSRQRNTVAPSAVAAEVATVPSEVVDLSAGSATDMEFHSLQLSVPMEARTATELRGPTVGAQALLSALPSVRPSMMRNLPPLDTAWAAWRRWTLPDWATLAATLPPDLRQLQSPPATATAPPQPTRSVLLPLRPSTSTEPRRTNPHRLIFTTRGCCSHRRVRSPRCSGAWTFPSSSGQRRLLPSRLRSGARKRLLRRSRCGCPPSSFVPRWRQLRSSNLRRAPRSVLTSWRQLRSADLRRVAGIVVRGRGRRLGVRSSC